MKKRRKERAKRGRDAESASLPSAHAIEKHLLETTFPRLHMVLILAVAALSAFGTSTSLLAWGVDSMGIRYGLATLAGYAFFLLVIRIWIRFQTRHWQRAPEPTTSAIGLGDLDVPDPGALDALGRAWGGSSNAVFSGGGGDFGGGGASGAIGDASEGASDVLSALGDADEGLPILIAIVAVLGGVLALGFVVYSSPVLLAEVLLDVAVVGALYRKNQKHERGHWTRGVIRRTYKPALVLVTLVVVFGFAVQSLAPERTTLGAVLEARDSD